MAFAEQTVSDAEYIVTAEYTETVTHIAADATETEMDAVCDPQPNRIGFQRDGSAQKARILIRVLAGDAGDAGVVIGDGIERGSDTYTIISIQDEGAMWVLDCEQYLSVEKARSGYRIER